MNRDLAVSIIKKYNPSIKIIHYRDIIPQKILSEIANFNKNDIIILLSVLRDEHNEIIPVEQTAKIISENTQAPIYSFF